MIFLSKISYSVYLIVFLVLFYFSGTVKSGEEFHLSSYIDRLEILIIFTAATIFTLAVDLPMQNVVKILLHSDETSNVDEKPEGPDFESPFGDDDDDFVTKRAKSNFGSGTNGYEAKTNGK